MTSTMTLSPIETIAQDIEDWGDGWQFYLNPEDNGRRVRIARCPGDDENIMIEIEIFKQHNTYFVHAGCTVYGPDKRWRAVSVSVRNPTTRKALDEINRRLDVLEGMTP